MKTEELAKIVEPLDPCGEGLDLLLKYTTVAEWFRYCGRINHVMWLWLAVACADTDDVFATELLTWLAKRTNDEKPWKFSLNDVKEIRLEDAPFSDLLGAAAFGLDEYTGRKNFKAFINTFRCPTDAELRKIKKWTDSWNDE